MAPWTNLDMAFNPANFRLPLQWPYHQRRQAFPVLVGIRYVRSVHDRFLDDEPFLSSPKFNVFRTPVDVSLNDLRQHLRAWLPDPEIDRITEFDFAIYLAHMRPNVQVAPCVYSVPTALACDHICLVHESNVRDVLEMVRNKEHYCLSVVYILQQDADKITNMLAAMQIETNASREEAAQSTRQVQAVGGTQPPARPALPPMALWRQGQPPVMPGPPAVGAQQAISTTQPRSQSVDDMQGNGDAMVDDDDYYPEALALSPEKKPQPPGT